VFFSNCTKLTSYVCTRGFPNETLCTQRKISIQVQKGLTSPQYLHRHKIIGHINVCGCLNSERENPSKHINIVETYAHKKIHGYLEIQNSSCNGSTWNKKTKTKNKGIRINAATNIN